MLSKSYLEYAKTLWEYYFPLVSNPSPVYLDMDEGDVEAMAKAHPGVSDAEAFLEGLKTSVREYIKPDATAAEFMVDITAPSRSWFLDNRNSTVEKITPPPQLPFLAATVLAAAAMGDEDFNPNAYYPRLANILKVDSNRIDLMISVYRKEVEQLWRGLNSVLLNCSGSRGLPTATAISHRFVSIPFSQVTVRQVDRPKIQDFFADSGFEPGSSASIEEITQLFQEWLSRPENSVSANLEKIWLSGEQSRERVADVFSTELQNWDGSIADSANHLHNKLKPIKLIMRLNTNWLGQTQFEIGAALETPSSLEDEIVLDSKDDESLHMVATRMQDTNLFELNVEGDNGNLDLMTALLRLGSESLGDFIRRAKGVVVFTKNPLLQIYQESSSPKLGEDCIVFASHEGGFSEKARALFSSFAEPGVSELSMDILEQGGWAAFQNVRFNSVPDDKSIHVSVKDLLPKLSIVLQFQGGLSLSLENRIQTWSSELPPTIVAVSPYEDEIRLVVERLDFLAPKKNLLEKTLSGGFGEWDISEENLESGDYNVLLYLENSKVPQSRKLLRLRSSKTPRPIILEKGKSLLYPNSGKSHFPNWLDFESGFARYPIEEIAHSQILAVVPNLEIGWVESENPQQAEVSNPKTRLEPDDLRSCSFTGSHRWDLCTCEPGDKYVSGTCTDCGRTKRFPCQKFLANKRKKSKPNPVRIKNVEVLKTASLETNEPNWPLLLGSLRFMGRGEYREIRDTARQLGADAIQTRGFARRLETLGVLQIENQFYDRAGWEITPPALVQTKNGKFRLSGLSPNDVDLSALDHEYRIRLIQAKFGTEIYFDDLETENAEKLASDLNLTLVTKPWEALMSRIPKMSNLLSEKFITIPRGTSLKRFSPELNSWIKNEEPEVSSEGAYRVGHGHQLVTILVSKDSLEVNSCVQVDTITAKHAAACLQGTALMSYDANSSELLVPIGAELPGLFGRFASSYSGRAPELVDYKQGSRDMKVLRYPEVDEEGAAALFQKLRG